MTYDPDDPRLTAYALGELDEHERRDMEALLAENEEARSYIDEVRQMASLLGETGLTDEQQACLAQKADRGLVEALLAATFSSGSSDEELAAVIDQVTKVCDLPPA